MNGLKRRLTAGGGRGKVRRSANTADDDAVQHGTPSKPCIGTVW